MRTKTETVVLTQEEKNGQTKHWQKSDSAFFVMCRIPHKVYIQLCFLFQFLQLFVALYNRTNIYKKDTIVYFFLNFFVYFVVATLQHFIQYDQNRVSIRTTSNLRKIKIPNWFYLNLFLYYFCLWFLHFICCYFLVFRLHL